MPHLVGTAGYVYPHWRRTFYPPTTTQSKELSYYLTHFNTVEINATWHAFPRSTTLAKWRAQASTHTRFVLKAPALITHEKRLRDAQQDIRAFLKLTSDALQHHLSAVLFQCPPSLHCSLPLLTGFLDDLQRACDECDHPPKIAMEFRASDWFCDQVYQVLKQRDIALVDNVIVKDADFAQIDENHFPHCRNADVPRASWTYTRFHGSKNPGVATVYPDSVLRPFAERARRVEAKDALHFAFFLNDLNAEAPKSATRYVQLLADRGKVADVLGGFVPVWAKKNRGIAKFFKPAAKGAKSRAALNGFPLTAKKSLGSASSNKSLGGLSPKKGPVPVIKKNKGATIGKYFSAAGASGKG